MGPAEGPLAQRLRYNLNCLSVCITAAFFLCCCCLGAPAWDLCLWPLQARLCARSPPFGDRLGGEILPRFCRRRTDCSGSTCSCARSPCRRGLVSFFEILSSPPCLRRWLPSRAT